MASSRETHFMIWFAVVVVVCFLTALLARMSFIRRPNRLRTDPLPNPLGFLIPAIIFSVFSGLRYTIGDTVAYIDIFERIDLQNDDPVRFRLAANAMFRFIEYQIRLRTEDPQVLIMVTALISLIPAIYILYMYSAPFELGIALFVLTGYYPLSMNGIRQYMAAAIVLLGTKYLFSEEKTSFLKYAIFIFLAMTIHSTALIMIPIYFIARRPAWRPLVFVMIAGTIVVTLLFNTFLPSFLDAIEDSAYRVYAENGWFTEGKEQGSNILRSLVLAVPLVLAYLWHDRIHPVMGRSWDILVNLSVFNLMFYILSIYNWLFARLAIYTSLYAIIMMTHLLSKGVSRENSSYMKVSAIGLYIIYFYNERSVITGYRSTYF